ncbi:MAG TPA: VWA domain-containing protein [Terriglobales bacterium]|nr:VWA domain-containing protein [Terriglobales bacterium]
MPVQPVQSRPAKSQRRSKSILRLLSFFACAAGIALSQIAQQNPVPLVNVGGNYFEAQFARLEFAQKVLEQQNRKNEEQRKQQQKLIDSGTVSVMDLQAPPKAVSEFNKGAELLQHQKPKEAVAHLEKAISVYPKFISAHNDLGLAYQDLDDTLRARSEFELAAKLDDKFAGSFLNLGRLALAEKDFTSAESHLEKAAALRPKDANILAVLAYAQNSAHQHRRAIETTERVHALEHKRLAQAHYVAAASAIELKEFDIVRRELELFLKEDPTNPLAPTASYNLRVLASYSDAAPPSTGKANSEPQQRVITYTNPEALKNALASLGNEDEGCADCTASDPKLQASLASLPSAPTNAAATDAGPVPSLPNHGYRIRQVVDEVAVFFSVTGRGGLISDLEEKQITIRDDGKAPARLIEFAPQSKLPLHLGLLIDTSGSLQPRFSFEKQAAGRFVAGMLRNPSDLAFVAGFANETNVTQDFTADVQRLTAGIDSLSISGGTAIWDAISFACWKLAAYPEKERVAKVLVILTDGEDNASRITLKQAIQDAETTGVTVYAISTKDYAELHQYGKSDADRALQVLTERTGGQAMFPGEVSVLDQTFDKLGDVIRSRYLVAYKPAEFVANGRYRKIEIVAKKNGRQLRVHARQGYYAPLESK